MWIVILIIVIITIFLAMEIRDDINWLYNYIARCELRIEELEKEERWNRIRPDDDAIDEKNKVMQPKEEEYE